MRQTRLPRRVRAGRPLHAVAEGGAAARLHLLTAFLLLGVTAEATVDATSTE